MDELLPPVKRVGAACGGRTVAARRGRKKGVERHEFNCHAEVHGYEVVEMFRDNDTSARAESDPRIFTVDRSGGATTPVLVIASERHADS